ncbi:MAG: IS1 family transposase, partial [Coleofasciculus sp. Co-bin14]|nr:IS1 family transposase [Coleofasciculus sp. Co-bin14]
GSKTVEIACPNCESTDLKKNGRRQGKPKYVCKACGQQFVIPDAAEAEEQPKIKANSPVETPKAKGSHVDTALDQDSGSSKPQSKKKKTKAKGFGKS